MPVDPASRARAGAAATLGHSLMPVLFPATWRGQRPTDCATLQSTDGEEGTDFLGHLGGLGRYLEVVSRNMESKKLGLKF